MGNQWSHGDTVLHICETLRYLQRRLANLDSVLVASMDRFVFEFTFVWIFYRYTRNWSDAYKVVPNLNSLVIKVAAASKAFSKELHAFEGRYREEYDDLHYESSTCDWRRCRTDLSELPDVFARFTEKIELLKPEIRKAYSAHLSTHPFQPQPPPAFRNWRWMSFCVSIETRLLLLSEKSDWVGGPLRKQMIALRQNLYSFIRFVDFTFVHEDHLKGDMQALLGQVAVRTAHICCLWWFAFGADRELKNNNVAILLSDLQQKIDLASPEFLEMILGFLEKVDANCESDPFPGRYRLLFVKHMLGVEKENILQDELLSLIKCVTKIPNMHNRDANRFSVDIKAVVMEARNMRNKDCKACKIDLVNLFARIWFVKAEIFLKEQQNAVALLMLSLEDQIRDLQKGLKFLRKSLTPTEGKTEKQILALIEDVPRQMESLPQSSHAEEFIGIKVRDALYKILVTIMLFKAKALLLEVFNSDPSLIVPVKRQIRTLHEGLMLVTESVINQPLELTEDEKLILTYIEAVAAGVISLCNSFPADEITEEAVMKMDLWLSDLLEMIQLLKPMLKELYLQIPMLNFPKTPRLGFIEFLLQKLKQLLRHKLDSVGSVTFQIEAIHEDLEILISLFRDSMKRGPNNQEHEDLCTRLIAVAYEAEYVIDSIAVGSAAERHHLHLLCLDHVSQEIIYIKMRAIDLYQNESYDIGICNVPQTLSPLIPQASTLSINEDVVVLNEEQQDIIDKLTRGSLQRDIVSIVGMPGIGKTTLAYEIYNNPEVVNHFNIRAWCCISQVYRKRDLLLDILRHITELTDIILGMDNEELAKLLYQGLKKGRYLIFMDGMWNTGAWYDLQLSFSDQRNGSRILITSRLHDVVSKVTRDCNIVNLRLLSDDESWELLKLKLFHEESYPDDLFEVGKEIARNCKGLPLSVVAIAGILNRTNKKQESWKLIAESLNSLIVGDQQTRCMDILELSYKHLPDDLKACFLYFGAFEEDKEIPVRRLKWLWMAEGFIQKEDSKSLEGLAENYLMNLIGRSLIVIAKRRSNGGVKACRVHDMVRSLCLLKAKEEKFLELITSKDEPYASFDDSVDFDDFDPSDSTRHEEYRLCICASRKHFVMSSPSGPYVRSLLFRATSDTYPRCPYDTTFISKNFKLLKVLDLEGVNMGNSFAKGIELLVQLHYLACGGDIDSIPSSIANLRNLETFLVKGLKGRIVLPDSIWSMTSLRHLHVDNHATFTLQNGKIGSSSELSNLVSLSSPSLSYGEHAQEILRWLPNLQKLSCIFSKSRDSSTKYSQFPRLEDLTQLESLKILFRGRNVNTGEFNFPSCLKKLTLSNFFLLWDHISTIGSLDNLEVLKLLSITFESTRWEMRDGEFPELKYLKLDELEIVEWSASYDHLPNLQQLVLRKCKNLKEIPIDFVEISTLQIIEVQRCGDEVEKSVRRLKEEEQFRCGTENLKVLICK